MMKKRKSHDSVFKAKVALEAVKGEKTIAQISSEYKVHSNQISKWKKKLLEELPELFSGKHRGQDVNREELEAELYRQIGQLKVELEWLKKNLNYSVEAKRKLIEQAHLKIPIKKQCELLGISRSGFYYQGKGISSYNLALMKLIDEQYLRTPFYGADKMTVWLRLRGHKVHVKRIRRLMRIMGLEAVYPKRNLSKSNKEHRKYPYLLRDMIIDKPDQVWCSDITYIRLTHGFVYLIAIMDWHSRYVLSWELSNLDNSFCLTALERALKLSKPEILNTDQGVQFTSSDFIEMVLSKEIRISMDGRGRAFDNIFIERLWRTLKYEKIYLKHYETIKEAKENISAYFHFYNTERLHQSLNYKTPAEIYFKRNELKNIKIFRQADGMIHLNSSKLLS